MTIKELCEMFIEADMQKVDIYNVEDGVYVWHGTADSVAYSPYADVEVGSLDNIFGRILTINI